ncbi:hypothetical protein N665_0820s0003 [Sinapis alba]|nr:hypothetical protein N665_0820s0003 [Sinapis alba]
MTGCCPSSTPQHLSLSFFVFFLFVPLLSVAQQIDINSSVWDFPSNPLCSTQQSNFSSSQFSKNLDSLVSSIPSLPANTYNFYTLSSPENSDQERVEAIGICNRVLTRVDCLNCISQAAENLTTSYCPSRREAYVRATKCMFRYSDKPIFRKLDMSPSLQAPNPNKATGDIDEFVRLQSELLNRLRKEAAAGGSKRKYAQGNGPGSLNTTFFAAVQCTPDLSEKDCNDCLNYGFKNATKGRLGIRWFCPSCSFQIESNLRFFLLAREYEPDPTSGPSPDPEPVPGPGPGPGPRPRPGPGPGPGPGHGPDLGDDKLKIVLAVVGSAVVLAIVVACLYFLLTRNRRHEKQTHEVKEVEDNNKIKDAQLLQLDFDTIRLATNDFSPDNKLGEGGCGAVYKGVLESGEEIAVKRLSIRPEQGDNNEFINEVSLVAKLQHRNLVRLLGFCLDGQERLLIFEFYKNTSLDNYIFDTNTTTCLEWETRYMIISGIARGLLYLHEDSRYKIIHRDLKAANVLLDDAMHPKIADFGIAKLFDANQTSHTRFTNRVAGTYGYMPPEYVIYGQFSVKTDVYSFGVLVLEIITGKRNKWSPEEESSMFLLNYVWKSWRDGKLLDIVDPSLVETRGLSDDIMKCIHIGLLCVQEKAESRPTMASVVVMFNASSFNLPRPSQPPFYAGDGDTSSSREKLLVAPAMTWNNVTITELDAR